jgi:hypothetical protein
MKCVGRTRLFTSSAGTPSYPRMSFFALSLKPSCENPVCKVRVNCVISLIAIADE